MMGAPSKLRGGAHTTQPLFFFFPRRPPTLGLETSTASLASKPREREGAVPSAYWLDLALVPPIAGPEYGWTRSWTLASRRRVGGSSLQPWPLTSHPRGQSKGLVTGPSILSKGPRSAAGPRREESRAY